MRPITLTGFSGSNQAINARQLPESVGVRMENCYPGLGDLRPLNNHTAVATVPTSPQRNTIWRMGRGAISDTQYWLGWSAIVNATLGFGTDTTERTYYTGDGEPKWTNNDIALSGGPPYPQTARLLGVPMPSVAPTIAMDVDGTGTAATRYYVETFVNDLGWESAPSPVSAGLLAKPGATVNLTGLNTPPAGNYGITLRRIYRTQSDTNDAAEFYFLREVAIGTTSTADDGRVLGELLPTEGWLPPPSNGYGIIALWNGMIAMLSGKTLHICEAGFPYAYPLLYQKELKDQPIATAKWSQNLLVLTTGAPVVFQGQDPAGMQDLPPRLSQACRSARGVVSFAHGVVWPSSEGLAYYGDNGQRLLTQDVLTPEQWRALNPDTMVAGRWQRFYVCSYDSGGGVLKGFMFDPLNPAGGIVYLSTGFNACHYDDLADQLYILVGGNVSKFAGAGTRMAGSFTSKQFLQVQPVTFGAAKVVASAYPVTFQVYADDVLKLTRSVTSREGFTLPDGFTAEDWQIKISTPSDSGTSNNVQSVRLAARIQDFKGL
jgi:hypothetical protein